MAGLFDFDNFDLGEVLKQPIKQLKADGNFIVDLFKDPEHAFGNHQDAMTEMQGDIGLNTDNKIVKNSDAIVGSVFAALYGLPALASMGSGAAGAGASSAGAEGAGALSSASKYARYAKGASKMLKGASQMANSQRQPIAQMPSSKIKRSPVNGGGSVGPTSEASRKYLFDKKKYKGY